MCAPLEVLKPYTKQGKLAPIEIRIKAAQKFGYPMEVRSFFPLKRYH